MEMTRKKLHTLKIMLLTQKRDNYNPTYTLHPLKGILSTKSQCTRTSFPNFVHLAYSHSED